MRRLARLSVLTLALVALVGMPATAHDRGHQGARHMRVPSFSVLVGSARQGGTLLIAAKVDPPRRHRHWKRADAAKLTATAVVHFATGDVQVTLAPRASKIRFKGWSALRGRSVWGRPFWTPRAWKHAWTVYAKVPVAADEPVGRIAVDVTITYGKTTATITTFTTVKPAKVLPIPEDAKAHR